MRALDRKLLRDLVRMRFQAGAIALLIACGVSVAVMAFSAQTAMSRAQIAYYRENHFADVFATARRAPLAVAAELARIPGVTAADPRAVGVGLLRVPGQLRPGVATLIALPDNPARALNRLVLIQGRYPDPTRTDEVVGLKTFLDAAHVRLGERATMIVNGRELSFVVVGSALSPEYVYVPGIGSQMPDDAHSGVFWGPRAAVEKAAGLGGAFSHISLRLAHGVDPATVLGPVDRALAPYGGQPAVARADQVSHKFQQEHIDRLGIIAWVIPPVFLVVASGLVSLVLGRLVDTEREQIGLLKAFGYGDLEASAPYLKMAAAIAIAGAAVGALLGYWMAGLLTEVFARYARYPHLAPQFSWTALLAASGVSAAAAMAGSLGAVRRAARLSPAIAMRPPTPRPFKPSWFESLGPWRALDQPTRMVVRNLERFPLRAIMTWAALGLSLSLLIGSQFMFGSFDEVLDQAYFRSRRWTEIVVFAELRDRSAIAAAARLPGVIAAQPVRFAPVEAWAHGRKVRAFVSGLEPSETMQRPLDRMDRPIPLKGDDLVISDSLARRLQVEPGDRIALEVTEGRRPEAALAVSAVAADYAGYSATLDRAALNRLMGDGDLASAALLQVAADRRPAFYSALEKTPGVVAASSRNDAVSAYRTTFMQIMTVEMTFFAGFAAAIAFGVAFNVARISLSDRARDLATLRVLGFGPVECAYILAGELILLALLAAPLGLAGGLGLAHALVTAFAHEEMQLPLVITPHSYGVALATYLAAVLAPVAIVARRIWSFDLVAVLKTRE